MAYTNKEFYAVKYFGKLIGQTEIDKWLSFASDEIDSLTFGRLIQQFPTIEIHAEKVQKAVCAIAEALYSINEQKKAMMAQKGDDGKYHGAISSISSGRESISYSLNNNTSIYARAAADYDAQTELLHSIAAKYLFNIPDATGVNLLYAGGD